MKKVSVNHEEPNLGPEHERIWQNFISGCDDSDDNEGQLIAAIAAFDFLKNECNISSDIALEIGILERNGTRQPVIGIRKGKYVRTYVVDRTYAAAMQKRGFDISGLYATPHHEDIYIPGPKIAIEKR